MSALDQQSGHSEAVEAPADDAVAVVPSDTQDLVHVSRALYVGGSGNVAVTMRNGQQVTFAGVAAGSLLPIRVRRVRATGTTATSILSLF